MSVLIGFGVNVSLTSSFNGTKQRRAGHFRPVPSQLMEVLFLRRLCFSFMCDSQHRDSPLTYRPCQTGLSVLDIVIAAVGEKLPGNGSASL